MKITTGDLNRRIDLLRYIEMQLDTGETTGTYAVVNTVSAYIHQLTSRELMYAAAINTMSEVRFTIRYYPALQLSTKDRIGYGSNYYNITGINNPDEEGKFLEITASLVK